MMKYFLSAVVLSLLISCNSSSTLKKEFPCESKIPTINLKTTTDVKSLFTVSLPENWNTNLFYDDGQTSIYAADTTVSLTKTIIIDASFIHAPIFLDNTFKQKITEDNKKMKLSELKTKDIKLLNKATYYSYAKGLKNKYPYHILNTFTKINSDNFFHTKTEIYGDSLVDERLCKAINYINKIQLK